MITFLNGVPIDIGRVVLLAGIAFLCLHGRVRGADELAGKMAQDCNAFGFKLQKVLRVMPGNYVVCPYSLHRVLSLMEEGSDGNTATELSTLLHQDKSTDRGERVKALSDSLRESAKRNLISFQSTNHLWHRAGIPLEQDFISKAKAQYGVIPEAIGFSDAQKARSIMNQTVSSATRGRVQQLLSPNAMDVDTSLILANTIYFKGVWQSRFDARRTKPRPFWMAAGKAMREVPSMLQVASLSYCHVDGFALVEMPIGGDFAEFSMLFLLPDDRDGLAGVEQKLTLAQLENAFRQLKSHEVILTLPKFSFSMGGSYKPMMEVLGASRMFTKGMAEFPRLSQQVPVALSDLLHEATVEVDEMGTEATAATLVPADPFAESNASVAAPNRYVVFNADHPFLFALRHSSSGLFLLMGRVNRL